MQFPLLPLAILQNFINVSRSDLLDQPVDLIPCIRKIPAVLDHLPAVREEFLLAELAGHHAADPAVVVAAGPAEALRPDLGVCMNIPHLVADCIIISFDQERGLDHEEADAPLTGIRDADESLFFHERVDNAVQRIRRKLAALPSGENSES